MAKINFNDKTYLNQNPSIADENKVNDTDLNELKYGTNDILDLLGLSTNTYNSSTNYTIGNRVIYNNQIYECIAATTGSWDSTKWQLIPLFDNQNINFDLMPDVYSTTETRTNKIWDNGKPIYRKVFRGYLTGTEGTTQSIAHGISNVDEFTFKEGFANSSAGGQEYPIPMYFGSTNYISLRLTNENIYFNSTPTQFTNQPFRLTLEYTKTTD